MWLNNILVWLRDNLVLLSALAAFMVFIIYDRRKYSLEIQKLKLEIAKIKHENLVYRPTTAEIKEVLEKTGRITTGFEFRSLLSKDVSPVLETFGNTSHRFLNHLLLYYGDNDIKGQIAREKLQAIAEHERDPYPEIGLSSVRFPDPGPVQNLWKAIRADAVDVLRVETLRLIENMLNRVTSRTMAA